MLVYGDSVYDGPVTPYDKINANKGYLKHYENSLFLSFMLRNGTREERHQASKELAICDRKMAWMQRHPNFDMDYVLVEVGKLKKAWQK